MVFANRATVFDHPGLIRWVACWLVTFGGIANSNSVHASCGDYLQSHGYSVHEFADRLDHHDIGIPPHPLGHRPPVGHRCSGPSCQRAPVIPNDTPQSDFSRLMMKEICVWTNRPLTADDNWSRLTDRNARFIPSFNRERIDRPPRIA